MTKTKKIGFVFPIEFKRGKDKKKRKRKSRRNEAIIAAASIGGGARIGGIHGFIRGRGGLGGTLERAYRLEITDKIGIKKARKVPSFEVGISAAKAGDKWLKENKKNLVASDLNQIKDLNKDLNKRGRKMAMKHAAIGAGIGAAGYGGYRAIKALRNRKAKKK